MDGMHIFASVFHNELTEYHTYTMYKNSVLYAAIDAGGHETYTIEGMYICRHM